MQELALILRSKISFVGSRDHYVAFNYILIRLSGAKSFLRDSWTTNFTRARYCYIVFAEVKIFLQIINGKANTIPGKSQTFADTKLDFRNILILIIIPKIR